VVRRLVPAPVARDRVIGLREAEAREEARDAGNKPRPADGTPNRRRLVGETAEEWEVINRPGAPTSASP
jgi:hypothetical protein